MSVQSRVQRRKLMLLILDGFGLSPALKGNAIYRATTPTLDRIAASYPFTALQAHGIEVGLGWGQMGNSEVGHLNLGAGRIVLQAATKISAAIEDGTFVQNQALVEACQAAGSERRLHLIGLVSNGGVHGHVDHLQACLNLAHDQGVEQISLHLIADGRDAEPKSFLHFYPQLEKAARRAGAEIATLMGRYYAMDRDRRWDRTQAAYEAMVNGSGVRADSIEAAIDQAYRQEPRGDEFIPPIVIDVENPELRIKPGDVVLMTNYRADRARQLAAALSQADFPGFKRHPLKLSLTSFTDYGVELDRHTVAFTPDAVPHQLADVLAANNIRQLHIAETEKYAHVTYFFNGGIEEEFDEEKRVLVNSPKVATYDKQPAMSAEAITNELLEAHDRDAFDVAVVNFANADMVGHTGNLKATTESIEVIDTELARILDTAEARGDTLVITADHGNAEQLIHPETGEIDKEHTANPVPLIVVDPSHRHQAVTGDVKLQLMSEPAVGMLADVAPTLLDLLDLKPSKEMTGRSLLRELHHAHPATSVAAKVAIPKEGI